MTRNIVPPVAYAHGEAGQPVASPARAAAALAATGAGRPLTRPGGLQAHGAVRQDGPR